MRTACVDVPALPLQLLWRREPAWRAQPTVVVDEDRPQGVVRWASEAARALRVLPGQRYATALSLAPGLRAGVVPPEEIAAAVDELAARLHRRSPEVTRSEGEPGTLWLGGAGLATIYPSATAWGQAIAGALAELGLVGVVVVGFSRFATCAIARGLGHELHRGLARSAAPPSPIVRVFARDVDERAQARAVPLDRVDVDPALRDALARLGVTTLGQLVGLPGGGILERFGAAAHRLYQLAAGEGWDPLAPEPPPEAVDERVILDELELDAERLAFALKAALDRLLARLAAGKRALTALYLELTLQHAVGRLSRRVDCIKPAAPTLDGRALLGLCRLRLEHQPPSSAPEVGVIELRVWADDVPATREQLALFAERPRRDRAAADAALARLRAELGDDAVVRAVLRPGHLPEARYGWERLTNVVAPRPRRDVPRQLVRRVLTRPLLLPPQLPSVRDDGWVLSGLAHGAVTRIVGPYVVSGGWWATELHREYHFAETRRGDCLWLYYDRARRRWFQQGAIE
jgi:protein ImuB